MDVTLAGVTVDCVDAARVAGFWAGVFGVPVEPEASPGFASVRAPGVALNFVAVPEPKTAKNRWHLDLSVPDAEAEAARLTGLGATVQNKVDEGGSRWIVMADLEGNEFCIG